MTSMAVLLKSGKVRIALLLITLQVIIFGVPWLNRVNAARGVETETFQQGDNELRRITELPVCSWIPPLNYPSAVPRKSLSGDVIVTVFLDKEGRIIDTEVLSSDLPELFIVEALKSARQSRFKGKTVGGVAEPSSVILPFHFAALEKPVEAETVSEPEAQPLEEPVEPATSQRDEPDPIIPDPPDESPAQTQQEDTVDGVEVEKAPAAEFPTWLSNTISPGSDKGESPLTLTDVGFGKGVVNRELATRDSLFAENDRVYCWMLIEGGQVGDTVQQVWKRNGRMIQEIDLTLKSASWRTWSYKTLFAGLSGSWEVEILDGDGRLLGRRSFECSSADDPE
ncbi:MAG: TonB family protein [bacterium]|nr:TonB family protein [bacterium]